MAGADYAHCDLEPCLKPTGSTKVFYDADTDIPDGTVIMHPECAAKVIAEAEARGYQRAIDALRGQTIIREAGRAIADMTYGARQLTDAHSYVLGRAAMRTIADYLEASAQTAIRSGESTE